MSEDKHHSMNRSSFDFGKNLKSRIQIKFERELIITPLTSADNDVSAIDIAELPNEHEDGGKQIHCPRFVPISCKHGHDVLEQFLPKQLAKFRD